MKLTREMFDAGSINPDEVKIADLREFVKSEGIDCPVKNGMSMADGLNKIVEALENPPEVLPKVVATPPPEAKNGPEAKKGRYGLGIRANGEHICPTSDGSEDKGSNLLNRLEH